MAVVLPWPVTALRPSIRFAKSTAAHMTHVLNEVTRYYCGKERSIKIHTWMGHVKIMKSKNREMRELVDEAWWETLDLGRLGRTRQLLIKHVSLLEKLEDHLYALQNCATREEFSAA